MTTRSMFEVRRANGSGYFWRLKGDNYETLCHSEVYTTKQAAFDGIAAVQRVAPQASTSDNT